MNRKTILFIAVFALLSISITLCSAADHWTSVKNAGVLRFGTSSDYIPFVYTEETELDGLDVALVKEMAGRLGLDVEVIDIAFDGLIDAAIIGQIDLIGGAFAITEERSEKLDFTNAYYESGGIFLCRDGNPVTEDTIKTAKIGVQKGTSFEQWIASNLVIDGRVSPANVFTYSKVKDVINVLKSGKVDLILIDEDIYRSQYKADPSLIEVKNQVVNEKFAYAAVKGSSLIPELNRVLREMFLDGTAQNIADVYFSKDFSDRIEASITRPAQIVEPTPIVPEDMVISREITMADVDEVRADNSPNCLNGMMYLNDVSLPDRTVLLPNMAATKTWRIKNTGTCTWDPTYTFNYVKGSVLGATTVKIDKLVAPGESYEISVDLVTPADNGEYTSWWQMRSPAGTNFGQTIWYDIQVSASSGSSNQKVQKGTPKIYKWYPDFYSTNEGKCPKVYYEVVDAYQVEFYVNDKFFTSTTNLSGYTSLCSPKKAGVYTFAIRAIGETAISDAFQFIDETRYPDPKVGQNVPTPYPHQRR